MPDSQEAGKIENKKASINKQPKTKNDISQKPRLAKYKVQTPQLNKVRTIAK